MPNITQNNIIMWLEDVVPQMQNAEDPTGCLLKYARDHNFSPAILERVGHMFNSLKTNSVYNMAKQASQRGVYVATLDVPALLEKYAEYDNGEIDYSKLKTNVSKNNSLGFENGETKIKLASIGNSNTGSIQDLCILADVSVVGSEEEIKTQELIKAASAKKPIKADTKKKDFDVVNYVEQCKQAKIHCGSIIQGSMDIMDRIENKFASRFNKTNSKQNFDEIELNAVYCADNSEQVKEAMEHLASALKSKTVFLGKNIKTASETGLYNKIALAKAAPAEMADVLAYTEAYFNAKEASEFIKEIDNDILSDPDINFFAEEREVTKSAGVLSPYPEISNDTWESLPEIEKQKVHTQYEKARDIESGTYDKNKYKAQEIRQNTAAKAAELASQILERKGLSGKQLIQREKDKLAEMEKKVIADNEESYRNLRGYGNIAKSVFETARAPLVAGLTSTGEAAGKIKTDLLDLYSQVDKLRAEGRQSSYTSPIQAETDELESRLLLEQLLYTDPVLSKLSDEETEKLMESYASLVKRNPDLATDTGLLRPLLRQIVAAGGVDLNTASTARDIYVKDNKSINS